MVSTTQGPRFVLKCAVLVTKTHALDAYEDLPLKSHPSVWESVDISGFKHIAEMRLHVTTLRCGQAIVSDFLRLVQL